MFNLFYYSMKNIKLFSLLFVAAAMIFAGCTKETESVEPGGGEGEGTEEGLVYKEFTVGASEVGGSKSRTVLGDGGSVLWVEGDEIRVFADVDGANPDGYKFTVQKVGINEDTGKQFAIIGGEVANAEKFYALYPFDAYSEKGGLKKENGNVYICANIPDNQSISVDGGYDPKACISVAELNSDGGEFKLACGMIGFKFTNETTSQIKEIQVAFRDFSLNDNVDDYLGHLKINIDGTVEHTGISEMRNIHLLPDGENQIFKTDKTYYVCLPPILATNNIALTVSFVDSESISLVKKISNVSLDRHQIRETTPLKLTSDDYHLTISNPGDFENWYNEGLNAYPEVTIKGTIDMTGLTLEAKDFSGILQGENCVIENLKMIKSSSTKNNGLFASLNGATISNITLVDLLIDGSDSYSGTICGVAAGNSTIKGCKIIGATVSGRNVGGIVGRLSDCFVDGCELTDVKLSAVAFCGGLVADFSEKSKICASYITGNIDSNGALTGGIIGMWNNYDAKIISCYSFMELPSGAGWVYNIPYPTTEPIRMHSSWYVNDKLSEYPDGTKTVEGLKYVMNNDNNSDDEIDESMNGYLKDVRSSYRYVVNPATITHFSTPPLILEKAQ